MQVAMIGAGYVGLVSGACFADFGHVVTCVDKDADKVARLRRGEMPIFEPGLDSLVAANMREKRLAFTTDFAGPVAAADAVFIAVGTPSRRGDGHADLSYVHGAAREIAAALAGFTVVVTKSTVPVGTGDEVERIIRETRPDADVAVVSNPEFLREGAAIQDFKHPDRIVVGIEDERARKVMENLYRPLYLNQAPLVYTTRRTAELIKYAANAFLATKITFINEIADLCEKVGADVQQVARGIGLDNRIGKQVPPCRPRLRRLVLPEGYGGADQDRAGRRGAAAHRRDGRRRQRRAQARHGPQGRGRAWRQPARQDHRGARTDLQPNTDDMREAPSIPLITALQDMGAQVRAYDPIGMEQARHALTDVTFCEGPYVCAEGADALVIVTEWEQFRALDFDRLKGAMKQAVVVDLRNVYRPEEMNGFAYHSIGRAHRPPA